MKIFAGNSNKPLSQSIISSLISKIPNADIVYGGSLSSTVFSDNEISVDINDNVRGCDVFVIQSTSFPANDNLMELLLIVDALKRASARTITAVIPYFGYARQDRRSRSARVPISAKVVANMLQVAGVSRVLTVELHADQIQGFFDIPVDNIYTTKYFAQKINGMGLHNPVIVSPDVGGTLRARSLAKQVSNADLVIIDKRRPKANEAEIMNIIGSVVDRECVLVDDIIDTGGTIFKGAKALMEHGAKSVRAFCTHGVLSGDALETLDQSVLTELYITDTIFMPRINHFKKIKQISIAELLSESIVRIMQGRSIRDLSQ